VILVDANLLIYSHATAAPQHHRAKTWIDGQLSGSSASVGLPWLSLLAFLRVMTNPRAVERPESIASAWAQVADWLSCDIVWIPQATDRHAAVLGELLSHAGAHGNLVMDAHLAALAIEHGLTLCSADSDFAKFPGLRWINPLAPDNVK
jgi:toxin-antitoxin system PIN domain toxin